MDIPQFMTTLHPSIIDIPRPDRVMRLPIDARGYPVPYFVYYNDGVPDHRVMDAQKRIPCIKQNLCWLCGEPLGRYMCFVAGPISCVNRVTSEPPMHLDCAEYALKTCPFLTKPHMERRTAGLPEATTTLHGQLLANPHINLAWVVKRYDLIPREGDFYFYFGCVPPEAVRWYRAGKVLSRLEVTALFDGELRAYFEEYNGDVSRLNTLLAVIPRV